MAIDHVEEIRELPFDRDAIIQGGQPLADYLGILIRHLAVDQLFEFSRRINALIDTNSVQYRYYAIPDPNTGLYPTGTWREGVNDSGQFVREKYVGGTWVEVSVEDV